ncbi:hypothetical protein [Pseudothermotoga sp.]|nr:hypothetical protein [Pseudothermotoga sp.]MCX7812495.1 hypothetical protein [Pseudothermotoga sp.]MDW8140049.1 hypothetical protein [Pseudothermotoga sp.]
MQEELKQDLLALRNLISDDKMAEIASNALKEALRVTIETKIRNIFSFMKFTVVSSVKLTKYLCKTVREEKWAAPKKWLIDLKDQLKSRAEKIKKTWESMTQQQKVDTAIDFAIVALSAFLVSGGFDLEGGLPDIDTKFGVGKHRNFFTHSILIGLTLEFVIRFLVALAVESEKHGYVPKSKLFQAFLNFAKKHHNAAISGMWLGLFLHFAKDANLFSTRTKPYTGINGLSMRQHQSLFTSNALAAAIFSQPRKSVNESTKS